MDQRLNESSIGRPPPVETEQGDHGLLFAHRATVRIVTKLSADLLPVFFFDFLIKTIELLMNQGKRFLFASAAQDSIMTDAWESFRENMK